MTAADWKTFRASMESAGAKFLDHSHFKVSSAFASRLVKAGGWELPPHGREICVTVLGCRAWLRNAECESEGKAFVVWGAEPIPR